MHRQRIISVVLTLRRKWSKCWIWCFINWWYNICTASCTFTPGKSLLTCWAGTGGESQRQWSRNTWRTDIWTNRLQLCCQKATNWFGLVTEEMWRRKVDAPSLFVPKKFRYWVRDVTLWSHIDVFCHLKAHSRDVEEARCCRPSAGSSRCWSSLLHSRLQHAIFKVDFFLYRKPVKVTLCNRVVNQTTYLCCCTLSFISRHLKCVDQVADLEDKAR